MKENTKRRIIVSEDKNKRIIRDLLTNEWNFKNFELWRLSDVVNEDNVVCGFRLIGGGFIGSGYITISDDFKEAVDLMKELEPDVDCGLFEIEKFKGYTIVLN